MRSTSQQCPFETIPILRYFSPRRPFLICKTRLHNHRSRFAFKNTLERNKNFCNRHIDIPNMFDFLGSKRTPVLDIFSSFLFFFFFFFFTLLFTLHAPNHPKLVIMVSTSTWLTCLLAILATTGAAPVDSPVAPTIELPAYTPPAATLTEGQLKDCVHKCLQYVENTYPACHGHLSPEEYSLDSFCHTFGYICVHSCTYKW